MVKGIKLGYIPEDKYSDYRYDVIFNAYKWDPQVGDSNTISKYALLMDRQTAARLEQWAEELSAETMAMEEALFNKPELTKELGLPKKILKTLHAKSNYVREKNVRLMRFDFHPTEDGGWAISEVNSDVPGGLAEASVFPTIAAKYFDAYAAHKNVAHLLLDAFKTKIKPGGTMAFVHATSYADDRQVMQLLGDTFESAGYRALYAAPDNIKWNKDGTAQDVDGIVRFYPLEWFKNLQRESDWIGFFDCKIPSCNHPSAMFVQSKRLPLIWDKLGLDIPTWKSLLPATVDPRQADKNAEGWILKPALGRVGEDILIKGTMPEKKMLLIEKDAKKHPENWIAQKMFNSSPLLTQSGKQYHLCIGVLTVDGKSAGFYGRINPYARIDQNAKDIPILVEKENI
ncbi:glutathionylspermidine synthase [Elusimicrobium posterum]|uniref:glutathionylspermidine synthase family protein n=1 Tax=Elusimicrobium posterum TaxID=3116653 RepID=UPI003C76AFCC